VVGGVLDPVKLRHPGGVRQHHGIARVRLNVSVSFSLPGPIFPPITVGSEDAQLEHELRVALPPPRPGNFNRFGAHDGGRLRPPGANGQLAGAGASVIYMAFAFIQVVKRAPDRRFFLRLRFQMAFKVSSTPRLVLQKPLLLLMSQSLFWAGATAKAAAAK